MTLLDDLPDKPKTAFKKQKLSEFDDEGKKKSQSTLLIEIGTFGNLFHDDNGDAYAEIDRNGVKMTMKIRSKEYIEYLSHSLYVATDKGANASAITDAKNTLEAKAKFSGNKAVCAVRAFNSENIYIDLGCDERRVIEITADGWGFVENAPVKFIRKKGMKALPEPAEYGDLSLLKKYINILDSELPLIIGWMLCSLGAVKPYPILILQGEQGTGKSNTTRAIRDLIDPSAVPLRTPPRDIQNLLVSANNTHIVSIDNLSGLSAEISDCLCRLSTGGGIDVRALYTDDEQNLIDIQRPVVINGIDDIANRPDLAERALILNLPIISDTERRREQEFWKEFNQDKSKIFTGLLNGLVSGLKHINEVNLKEKPRMADVAHWVTACERGLGIEGAFITAHTLNQQASIESNIEASPVGSAIKELMNDNLTWSGTPTQLFNKLEQIAGDKQVRSRSWPQSLKGMNNIIKRLMPAFRKTGISIIKNDTHSREYFLESVRFYPPQPPQPHIKTENKPDLCADSAHCADRSQEFLKTTQNNSME